MSTDYYSLNEKQVVKLKDYLIRREEKLDHDLLPYGDPRGKDILVFGCGFGNEVLWAARHGAKSVLAIDLSGALSPLPFERAIEELGINYTDYEFRRENIHNTALSGRKFDLIVSNGVFEHVHDLKGVLAAFRPLLTSGGRVAIFADGLWFSSIGGHIKRGPWEHLWRSPAELKPELAARHWDVLCNQLNRMTTVDFLEAVRSVDMIILQFNLRRDPNLSQLGEFLPPVRRRHAVSLSDLSVVAIGCELCFEENL